MMISEATRERIAAAVEQWFEGPDVQGDESDPATHEDYRYLADEVIPDSELRRVAAELCDGITGPMWGKARVIENPGDPVLEWYRVTERIWEFAPVLTEDDRSILSLGVFSLLSRFCELLPYCERSPLGYEMIRPFVATENPDELDRRVQLVTDNLANEVARGGDTIEPWVIAVYLVACELSIERGNADAEQVRFDPQDLSHDLNDEPWRRDRAYATVAQAIARALRISSPLKEAAEFIVNNASSYDSGTALALQGLEETTILAAGYFMALEKSVSNGFDPGIKRMCSPENALARLVSAGGNEHQLSMVDHTVTVVLAATDDESELLDIARRWLMTETPTFIEAFQSVWWVLCCLDEFEARRSRGAFTPVDWSRKELKSLRLRDINFAASAGLRLLSDIDFWQRESFDVLCESLYSVSGLPWSGGSRNECIEATKHPEFLRAMIIGAITCASSVSADRDFPERLQSLGPGVSNAAHYALQALAVVTRSVDESSPTEHPVPAATVLLAARCGLEILIRLGQADRAVSPLLHVWRIQKSPALPPGLYTGPTQRPTADALSVPTGITMLITHLFMDNFRTTPGNRIRHAFVQYCLGRFKRSRKRRESATENLPEGWDADRIEPSPRWRKAYVRALAELEGNPHGKVFRTLEAVTNQDRSDEVRSEARTALERIGEIEGNYSSGSPLRTMMHAWFELRRTHKEELGEPIDEETAAIAREREIREGRNRNRDPLGLYKEFHYR